MRTKGAATDSGILKRLPLRFSGLTAAELRRSDKGWIREGCTFDSGNYTLEYSGSDGGRIDFANTGYRLILQVPQGGDIDVTGVSNHSGITRQRLLRFLHHVDSLDGWGGSIQCRLVVRDRLNAEVSKQNADHPVPTPVRPWIGKPNPELLAKKDSGIRYCMREGTFFGQVLKHIEGDPIADRQYFTLGGVLQTHPQWRGFACIGLVGNVYGVDPERTNNPYDSGQAMCARLEGRPFGGEWDSDALCAFLKSDGKTGWYLIWIHGHAGLIWDGVLYECKQPGHGFTKESFSEESESAVRRFTVAQLESRKDGLNVHHAPYRLARLPPPDWL
jgi:hypothetical protein